MLARVGNFVNDRPIGVWVLLGQTSTVEAEAVLDEDFERSTKYQEELLDVWWSLWKQHVFPYILPYYWHKVRNKNPWPGEVCLLKFEGKVCRPL